MERDTHHIDDPEGMEREEPATGGEEFVDNPDDLELDEEEEERPDE